MTYNAWPLGNLPKEFRRPEINKLRSTGYKFKDAREVVGLFEKKVAQFSGSKYAVAVDSCSNGIFLSLKYLQMIGEIDGKTEITIPRHTYISVPMQILHAGARLKFADVNWTGVYKLSGTRVWDGAVRWTEGMYVGGDALQVVSFQLKKRLPIGRGGAILTDSESAYKQLKLMSYDGRDLTVPYDDPKHIKCLGYHMYMTPEDAGRGLLLMEKVPYKNEDSGSSASYPNVEQMLMNI